MDPAGPLPCRSVLTADCIERGRDITDGGAVYNYHSICFLGTANVADSLAAIRRLVFEQRRIDAGELMEALREDPERYGNITVQVAGYSQMFRLVPPDLQEYIIARTKHSG